jgi:hypothetical protein
MDEFFARSITKKKISLLKVFFFPSKEFLDIGFRLLSDVDAYIS